ncbi:hypothetical protein SAMN05660653_00956 [Desulfonatronum thiosulfatophilum]|uniref:Uncharacterized protein n=1 Tax=Desulfonatronum thiosulfatophilum TaxID=617002 RepID=A0A1G6BHT8_9BACT|nr:hypothetical protein [Desulfonatronum thiosulfatophilum]SDB20212.1 hypothetical protein SAMN05660653_00956 [Desulfonatronum thiosulfatophilum]
MATDRDGCLQKQAALGYGASLRKNSAIIKKKNVIRQIQDLATMVRIVGEAKKYPITDENHDHKVHAIERLKEQELKNDRDLAAFT